MVLGERAWLSRHTVVAQALALADLEGLAAVTIRRLADQLRVTPMGMYWHVKNRDELLTAMSDQLLAGVIQARGPEQPWHLRLRAMIVALLDVLRAHPCAPTLLATSETGTADGFTRVTDAALEPLRQAGFTPREAHLIASLLLHGVLGLMARQPAEDLDAESHFAFGVDVLLAGVEAMAAGRRAAVNG